MAEFVTHTELDEAIAAVKDDIAETEQRLRREWKETVRFEVGRVDTHLDAQDGKIDRVFYLIVTMLLSLVSSAVYILLRIH